MGDDWSTISPGDTGYILLCGALVMFMTPGLGLFYGGMVSTNNVLNTLMLSLIAMCLVAVQWLLFGYSFAFGNGSSFFGSFQYFGSEGVGKGPDKMYGENIPEWAFWWFQLTFAMITPALISGSVVGRIRLRTWVVFTLVWTTVVYDAIAHWSWSAYKDGDEVKFGWLRELGALDFAGGTVIEISSGFSGLAAALVIGRPTEANEANHTAHSVPMVFIGMAMLWFGWCGFNGGSALNCSDGIAALATVNTNIAASMGMLTWLGLDACYGIKSTLGAMNGAISGLVCITASAGFIRPLSALAFGFLGPLSTYYTLKYMKRGIADTLDVFFCHGVSGAVGMILIGFFAEKEMNPNGGDGVFFGGSSLLGYQLIAVAASAAWSFVLTALILLACKAIPFIGLRPSTDKEDLGLDYSLHNTKAYQDDISGSGAGTATPSKVKDVENSI